MDEDELDLDLLAEGTPRLSPAAASDLVESAVVCLLQHGHVSGTSLELPPAGAVRLKFCDPDPRAFGSRADLQEATERGATAIAIAVVKRQTGLGVLDRSRKGTGCDWYIGEDDGGPPFQNMHRLEISGILDESEAKMRRRLVQKVQQLERGNDDLPGYVVVVGFRTPVALVDEQ